MQLATLFAFIGASAAAVQACNANNCLRQVKASAFSTRSAALDCSRYQTTYTTPVMTVTAYSSIASVSASVDTPVVRTIPKYASSCGDNAAYRSACSCLGSTSTMIIAPTLTVTVAASCTTVALQATSGAQNGKFFVTNSDTDSEQLIGDDLVSASKFVFRNGRFTDPGGSPKVLNGYPSGTTPIFFDISDGNGGISPPLTCVIDGTSSAVSCIQIGGNSNTFFVPDGTDRVRFGTAATSGDSAFIPKAVLACSA